MRLRVLKNAWQARNKIKIGKPELIRLVRPRKRNVSW
jgi:hypothetical protein